MACSLSIFSIQGKEVPFSFFNVPSPSALGGKSCLKDVKIKCDIEIRGLLLGFEALLQLVRKNNNVFLNDISANHLSWLSIANKYVTSM